MSQAEGVEMVLALQKIIEELQEKLAIAIATIRSVLDRLSVHKEDFVYRDRSAGTKGFN
ncbi:hypothetical protein [Microcoleus sp. MON2_D5]|uniref:hypothetical protein n=1 Tax=Microcoleus sp. MON2_D5 TaxID=2818833 RepID=UPI002FD282CB